jgi:hypothetical protein
MPIYTKPYLIEFPKIGSSALGYISVAEGAKVPFEIKRVYWTYFTPEDVNRGGHAHFNLEQILIAPAGRIVIRTEMLDGSKDEFVLDKPNVGVFISQMCWREMSYSHNAVQMCLASIEYSEEDYIREYAVFKNHKNK